MTDVAFIEQDLFRKAALANDPVAFMELAEKAKQYMRLSIEDNRLEDLSAQQRSLMASIAQLASYDGDHKSWGKRPPAFMLPLLPLLPKNTHEAFKHLGFSAEIDAYLLEHKLDIERLTFGQNDMGYRTLLDHLKFMGHGPLYGKVIERMARRLEALEPTHSESRRVATTLLYSIGTCMSDLGIDQSSRSYLESSLPTLLLPRLTLNLADVQGFKHLNLPLSLGHFFDQCTDIDALGNTSQWSARFPGFFDWISPHLNAQGVANLTLSMSSSAAQILIPLGKRVFEEEDFDRRACIHTFTAKHSKNPEILFELARLYLDEHKNDPDPAVEPLIVDYLDVLVENSQYKENHNLKTLARCTGISVNWWQKTDWHLVDRLEKDLAL